MHNSDNARGSFTAACMLIYGDKVPMILDGLLAIRRYGSHGTSYTYLVSSAPVSLCLAFTRAFISRKRACSINIRNGIKSADAGKAEGGG
jgi:hypothetical protein